LGLADLAPNGNEGVDLATIHVDPATSSAMAVDSATTDADPATGGGGFPKKRAQCYAYAFLLFYLLTEAGIVRYLLR
jgi:hypothetical protein